MRIRPIIKTTNFKNGRPVFKAGSKDNPIRNESEFSEEMVSVRNLNTDPECDASMRTANKGNYGYNKEIVEDIGPDGKTYFYLEDRKKGPMVRMDSVSPRDPLGIYFKEIDKYPLLTDEEEYENAKKMCKNNDENARQTLIKSNLRFVVFVAGKYMGRGMHILDMIQEGNRGLIRATKSFDYTRGFKFCSYAVGWIDSYITKAIDSTVRTVRVPMSMQKRVYKIKKATAKLAHELNRAPTIQEIADETGIPEEKIKVAIRSDRKQVSMDAPLHPDDSRQVIDSIDTSEFPILAKEEAAIDEMRLKNMMSKFMQLSAMDQEVLNLKFGLKSGEGKTWSQVAQLCEISESQAKMALIRLKKLCKSGV